MKDIYWLAGILEGEATFRFKGYGPAISLRMTDSDVVGRAAQIWKKPILGPYAPSGRFSKKPSWSTEVTCSEAAGWMMTLFPLLGIRRREQIQAALTLWKKVPARPYRVWGRDDNPTCPKGHLRAEHTKWFILKTGPRKGERMRNCLACTRDYMKGHRAIGSL